MNSPPSVQNNVSTLSGLLKSEDRAALREWLDHLSESGRVAALVHLSLDERRQLIQLLGTESFAEIMADATPSSLASFLSELPSDETTDVIGQFPLEKQPPIVDRIEEPHRSRVQRLLLYGKDTAGGIMSGDFVAFPETHSVQDVIDGLRRMADEPERVFYVYAVDDEQRLKGVLSMRDLVIRPPETPVRDMLRPSVITITAGTDQEEVARIFHRHRLLALPVADEQNKLLGVITVDDVAEVIRREATEDFLKMSGIPSGEESIHTPFSQALKKRLPWLMFNMLLNCVAVSVVAFYQGTIQALVAVAVLMPMISDMGGNTGFQNLSLIIRGLATGEVTPRDFKRILFRQSLIGLAMGFVLGLEVALIAYLWQNNPLLGVVAGLAMFANIYIASLIGAVLPLGLKALRIDPAIATGPLMTTMTDMSGFFVTLWLTSRFLPYL